MRWSSGESIDVFSLGDYDLGSQPQRPGELTVPVVVTLLEPARRAIAREAANAGLPVTLWLTIAIEARRCVSRASEIIGMPADDLVDTLNQAATRPRETRVGDPALARLRAYSRAVLRGPHSTNGFVIPGSLPLSPSLHVAASWSAHAEQTGVTVEEWASEMANSSPAGRGDWEAASAADGQPLAEWTLAQAARRWRLTSTSAYSDIRS